MASQPAKSAWSMGLLCVMPNSDPPRTIVPEDRKPVACGSA